MKTPSHTTSRNLSGIRKSRAGQAFTRLEVFFVISGLMLMISVCLPLLANTSLRSDQIACLNNLRQIGIAFQAWGTDYEDNRPWFVSTNASGPLSGGTRFHPLWNNAYLHYTVLSNHLAPQALADPADPRKRAAQRWDALPQGGFLNPGFANNALSYMLGVHSSIAEAKAILSADRNVAFSGAGGCSIGFSSVAILTVRPENSFRGWTNGPHGLLGNVLFSDGQVESTSNDRLKARLFQPDDFGPSEHFLTPF